MDIWASDLIDISTHEGNGIIIPCFYYPWGYLSSRVTKLYHYMSNGTIYRNKTYLFAFECKHVLLHYVWLIDFYLFLKYELRNTDILWYLLYLRKIGYLWWSTWHVLKIRKDSMTKKKVISSIDSLTENMYRYKVQSDISYERRRILHVIPDRL